MNAQLQEKPKLSPLRVGRITGSRAPKILGLSKYGSRKDVMREMVREHFGAPSEFEGNEATRYGESREPFIIDRYEVEKGAFVYERGEDAEFYIHPVYSFLGVTPDGLIGADGMIEGKAPYMARYTHINERPDYEVQVRLQLDCTGRKWCDFAVEHDAVKNYYSRVEFDPNWLDSVLPQFQAFMDEYNATIADPKLSKPYLTNKKTKSTKKAAAELPVMDLTVVQNDLAKVFTLEGIRPITDQVVAMYSGHVFDITKAEDRERCAATAKQIMWAKNKVDNAGKEFVSGLKEQAKVVDNARKHWRDKLEALAETVREPLTRYEAEQDRIAQAKAEAEAQAAADAEAKRIADIEAWEREIAEREKAVRDEQERIDRERREKDIAEQAAAKAKADMQAELDRREREAVEMKEAAEREKIQAAQRLEQAERDAKERAEREQNERLAAEKRESEARAADESRRAQIHQEITDSIVGHLGIESKIASDVANILMGGLVPNVTVQF